MKAFPRETTEAFLDGRVLAFDFFDGNPQSILYDNTSIAVAKIFGGGKRERTSRIHPPLFAISIRASCVSSVSSSAIGGFRLNPTFAVADVSGRVWSAHAS